MLRRSLYYAQALRGGVRSVASWATVDAAKWNGSNPAVAQNIGAGGRAWRTGCWLHCAANVGHTAASVVHQHDPWGSHALPCMPPGQRALPPCLAVGGKWVDTAKHLDIPDPLNGEPFTRIPDTQPSEVQPFVDSLRAVPKTGLHNPFKHPERSVGAPLL